MSSLRSIGLAFLGLAAAAQADWVLNTYNKTALDTPSTNKEYGIQSFSNPSSITSVSVPETGYARLSVAKYASEGTEGYTANLGLLHPLRKDWSAVDISSTDSIRFEFRYDRRPTGGFEMGLSSKLYPKAFSDSGYVHMYKLRTAQLPPVDTWRTISVPVSSLLPPDWYCVPGSLAKPCPDSLPSREAVLRKVEAIQFAPKTNYTQPGTQRGAPCTFCVTPNTTQPVNVDIRNVTLVGYEETVPNPAGIGCQDAPSQVVDDLTDGDNANELGGYWFAFSDTSTSPAKDGDSARGTSSAAMELGVGAATLTAGLHKKTGGVFDWRPYAGWAAIGTNFENGEGISLPGLSGISFNVKALKLGPNVKGVNFKVTMPGISEATTHFAFLPAANIDPTSPAYLAKICVRPEDLQQPSWFAGAVPFKSDSIIQIAWEVKIGDQSDELIHSDTAIISVSNIALYKDSVRVGIGARRLGSSFSVAYRGGLLNVQPVAGYEQISVVSPSGRVAARFTGKVQGKRLDLERGTWYVVARSAKGESLVRTIAVLR